MVRLAMTTDQIKWSPDFTFPLGPTGRLIKPVDPKTTNGQCACGQNWGV